MKYFNLNKLTSEEYKNPVLLRINEKTFDMLREIIKIVAKHRELEKEIIAELAKLNDKEDWEMSELLAEYDFLCDTMEYGNSFDSYAMERKITFKEYYELKKAGNNDR